VLIIYLINLIGRRNLKMIIAAYYINRSTRLLPCWDVANSLKEAKIKAKKWAIDSNCYVSIDININGKEKQVILFDEKGKIIKYKRSIKK